MDSELVPSKDKMTDFGVFTCAPIGGDGNERVISHIGKLDDWAKTKTPKAGVLFVVESPGDTEPFVALGFKVPRQKDLGWTFSNGTLENQRYHQATLRFHSDQFEMRYHVLHEHEVNELRHSFNVPVGMKILAIRFRMFKGEQPQSIGFVWPSFPADGDGKIFEGAFPHIQKARCWTLYVEEKVEYYNKFKNIARTFAQCGRGGNTNHYRKAGTKVK
jgi:hypothetical protein